MKFEYVIPKRISQEHLNAPLRFRQSKDIRLYTAPLSVGAQVFTEIPDHVQRMITPTGLGGKVIYVYNFTNTAICMIDSNNAIVIIEPLQHSGIRDVSNFLGSIVVEVCYHNQDQPISKSSEVYLTARRDAFLGLTLGAPADNLYNSDHVFDNFVNKASETQRYRYTITKAESTLDIYDGAFYMSDLDIIIGEVRNPGRIWIHPNSDPTVKAKARNKLSEESLGIEVSINDTQHVYDKAFINIAGKALEVPVTRNPAIPEGICIWHNVHQHGVRPDYYPLDAKDCPLKIYTSITDALSAGSAEKILEKELLEEKARIAREKQQHEREEFDRQKKRQAEEERRKQAEFIRQKEAQEREEQRRREQEKNFDRVERVTFWRKILIEGAKAVAAAASTAAILIGLYLKHKAS